MIRISQLNKSYSVGGRPLHVLQDLDLGMEHRRKLRTKTNAHRISSFLDIPQRFRQSRQQIGALFGFRSLGPILDPVQVNWSSESMDRTNGHAPGCRNTRKLHILLSPGKASTQSRNIGTRRKMGRPIILT